MRKNIEQHCEPFRKKHILRRLSVKLGCCGNPKLSSVFSPTPHRPRPHPHSSSSAAWETTTTVSSSSTPRPFYSDETEAADGRAVQGFGRIDGESVAVEKDSDDPYQDFRRSMLQMILERGIYSRDDLKELLNCFLQLNSPYYHGIIVRAFTEIWNGVYSSDGPPSMSLHGGMWGYGEF